jgi:thiol-disulfide isomerase/thioredoxin
VSTRPNRRFRFSVALTLAAAAALVIASVSAWLLASRIAPPPGSIPVAADEPAPLRSAGDLVLGKPKPLPALAFVDAEGRAESLSQFRGKVVLLNLWATWCVPCRKEMPTLDRLQAKLSGPDFEVVALSIDRGGAAPVQEFYRSIGIEHLALHVDPSGRAASAVSASGIPATLVVDRDGREIGRKLGAAEWDGPDALAVIKRAIEGSAASAEAPAHSTARGGGSNEGSQ